MKTWKQILRFTGYGFIAMGALAMGYVLFRIGCRWTVLEHPIKVEEGYSFHQTFTVDHAETYVLRIRCEKTIPFDELENLMLHDVATTFSVHDGSMLVADNTFRWQEGFGFSRQYVFRGIGRFAAKPWHTYQVDFRVERSLPALAPTHPCAIIQADVVSSNKVFVQVVYAPLSLFLLGIGTILVQPYYRARRRQKLSP